MSMEMNEGHTSYPTGHPRFALVNVWSDHNRGDAAIVHATYDAIRRKHPGARIDFHNVVFNCRDTKMHFDEHFGSFKELDGTVYPALFPGMFAAPQGAKVSQLRRLLYALRAMAMLPLTKIHPRLGALLTRKCERSAYESLTQSDMVLSKGGSYLIGDRWGSALQITMVLFPLVLASVAGRKTALVGVSVGPARSRVAAAAMRFWFRWVDLFVVREQDAYDTCIRLGVPREKVSILPDFAFLLSVWEKERPAEPDFLKDVKGPRVAVTVRSWRFDDAVDGLPAAEKEKNYLAAVARALRDFHEKTGGTVVLVPQVIGPGKKGSDIGALERLAEMLGQETQHVMAPRELNHRSLRAVYRNVDMLIGTRLHSVILAFGTPTVIIGYQGNKSIGTARLLGYENAFVHINDVHGDAVLERMWRVWTDRENLIEKAKRKKEEFEKLFDGELDRIFRLPAYGIIDKPHREKQLIA